MSESLGVYLHIPFCRSKCPYCDFFTSRPKSDEAGEYVDLLCEKIGFWGKKLDKTVDTIYLGGGTPSILPAESICRIIDAVKTNFKTSSDPEITMEANPASGQFFDFDTAHSHGVNRVSVGIQSVNPSELKTLGRIHTVREVENTLDLIKSSGINNISLDLMLGIPDQTIDSLRNTLEFFVNSGAVHISSYILKLEENTIFYKRSDRYNFPYDDETAELYLFAVKFLESHGFRQYEVSNFAKEGYESRHNLKYWKLDDYIGIGPAAHSMIDGKRFYYNRSFEDFRNDVSVDDGNAGDVFEYIMLGLRLAEGVNVQKLKEAFGEKISESFKATSKPFINNGFMHGDGNNYALTPKGFLVSNSIIVEISSKIL